MFMESCLKNNMNDFFCMINNFVMWTLYVDSNKIIPYVK